MHTPTGFCAWRDQRNVPSPPLSLLERGYNVVFRREQPQGGHFQPSEEPDLFVDALRDWGRAMDAR